MAGIETTEDQKILIELWRTIGKDPNNWKQEASAIDDTRRGEISPDEFLSRYATYEEYTADVASRAGAWRPEIGISALDTSELDYFSMHLGRKFKVTDKATAGETVVTRLKEVLFASEKYTCENVMRSSFENIYGSPCNVGVNDYLLGQAAEKMGVSVSAIDEYVADNFDTLILIRKLIEEIEEAEKRENERQAAFKSFWSAKALAFRMKYEDSKNIRYLSNGKTRIKSITWKDILARVQKIETALKAGRDVFDTYLPLDAVSALEKKEKAVPFELEETENGYLAFPGYTIPEYTLSDTEEMYIKVDKKKGSFSVSRSKDPGFRDVPREVNANQAIRFFCAYVRFLYKNLSVLEQDTSTPAPNNALGLYMQDPEKLCELNPVNDSEMKKLIDTFRKEAKTLRDMPDEALLLDTARILLTVELDTLANEQIRRMERQERSLRVTPIVLTFVFFAALIGVYAFFRYTLIDQKIGQLSMTALIGLIVLGDLIVLAVVRRNRQYLRKYGTKSGRGRRWVLSFGIVSILLILTGCYFMGRYDAYDETYYYNRRADHTMVVAGLYDTRATDLTFPDHYEDYAVTGIADISFLLPNSVKSVTLPASYVKVGAFAFRGCGELETVDISSASVSLGAHAFEGCKSLTSVVLEKGTTTIPKHCFKDCTSLLEIAGADAVITVESGAFDGCTSLNAPVWFPNLQTIEEKAFRNTATNAVSLSKYLSIGEYAFSECNDITELKGTGISADLILEKGAFSSCESLISVDLTFEGTALPAYLFENCTSLTDVAIRGTVSKMGKGMLDDCPVETLTLPYLGDEAESFEDIEYFLSSVGKKTLTQVTVTEGSLLGEDAFDGCGALSSVTMLQPVETIGEDAFYECYLLMDINIVGVKTIEDYAFYRCYALDRVPSEESLTTIGEYAFAESGVTAVRGGEELTEIGRYAFEGSPDLALVDTSASHSLDIGKKAFANCAALTNVKLYSLGTEGNEHTMEYMFSDTRRGITSMQIAGPVSLKKSFEGCESLTAIDLSDLQITIPEQCFKGCSNLAQVTGKNVTIVGEEAFMDCTSLTTICFDTVETVESEAYRGTSVSVLNAPTICTVGEKAFAETPLTSICLPNASLDLGKKVFDGCETLSAATVGRLYHDDEPVTAKYAFGSSYETLRTVSVLAQTELADEVFGGCSSIEVVDLSAPLEIIPEDAFYECYFLAKVNANGVKKISKYAFYRCYALDRVPCETELVTIEKYAFSESGVTYLQCGAPLVEIGTGVFEDAVDLAAIDLSACVDSDIGKNAFSGCDSLTDVKLYALGKEGDDHSMKYLFGNTRKNIRELQVNGIVSCTYAFEDCEELISISLSDLQTEIPKGAFSGCVNLQTVKGTNVTKIGDSAFKNCTYFSYYAFGELTEIGAYAFANTSMYSFITTPALKEIGKYAFENTLLYSVEIVSPDTVVGEGAFEDCTGLTQLTLNALGTEEDPETLYHIFGDAVENIRSVRITNQSTMAKGAFKDAEALTSIVYDLPVFEIPKNAFKNCSSLLSFDTSHAVEIGRSAFENCTMLDNVTLSEDLTEIGAYAFKNCTSLGTIVLPDGLSCIEKQTFSGCSSLRDVTFGSGIKSIEKRAFQYCSSLSAVELNEGLEKIRKLAFFECESLSAVYIPSTITKLGCLSFFDLEQELLVLYNGTSYDWDDLSKGWAFLGTDTINVFNDSYDVDSWENYVKQSADAQLYRVAEDITESQLYNLAREYGYDVLLPEYSRAILECHDTQCYDANTYRTHYALYIAFAVDPEEQDDFWNNYIAKLVNGGYDTYYETENGEWEVIKNDTIIRFGSVQTGVFFNDRGSVETTFFELYVYNLYWYE